MKISFAYLFRRLRRLREIPPRLHAGDPAAKITCNLKPKAK